MNKDNLEKLVYRANLFSIGIVSISVIAIVLYAVLFFYPTSKNEVIIKIDYPLVIDSTSIIDKVNTNVSAKFEKSGNSDSLKKQNSYSLNLNLETKDLNKINQNNELIYKSIDSMLVNFQRNQSIILAEKKERESFISFTSGILAIIIAISGFFGFKSINEMKKAAIDSAEEQAKAFLRNKDSEIDELYEKKISKAVDIKIETVKMLDKDNVKTIIKKDINALNAEIQTLNLRIEKCCPDKSKIVEVVIPEKVIIPDVDSVVTATNEKEVNNSPEAGLFSNVDLTKE